MKALSNIWFPVAVTAIAAAGALGLGEGEVHTYRISGCLADEACSDTVIYEKDAWKSRRVGDFLQESILDSLFEDEPDTTSESVDTIPHLTARDTIKAPDSLRFTDPFRFKYYVALVDSLTHVLVRDSLKHSSDSLKESFFSFLESGDTVSARADSLHSRLDSLDWRRIDSIYVADSTSAARAAFLKWYNSLSRKERRKYDIEQMIPIKMAEMDSIRKAKEDAQAIRDSIIEYTPRILETFAIPDSMQYKRIIAWTTDPDFHRMDVHEPDTTFNRYFYDYPFQRRDVNATWLGVAGSPVQYYDYFKREGTERVPFYEGYESWSKNPSTFLHYNSKTPHTELCYYGTLLSQETKESDNLHIFTTQNITPAFNFSILFDRFGGGGILQRQETKNKTLAFGANYLGKKYLMHAGVISNTINSQENGGICERMWIRDTTVDSREIAVNLKKAQSELKKRTFFLEQQLRIPFTFINEIKARRDSTFSFEADSLDRDITTAFIGHSSEFSTYTRTYSDAIDGTDAFGRSFYHDVFRYNERESFDSLRLAKLDNKVFLRLQPWSDDAIVSKLDLGVGDRLRNWFDSCATRPQKHVENSFYVYAGAEGRYKNFFDWDAKADFVLLGHDFGDFDIQANATFQFFPFRKARKSPVSLTGHFGTSLLAPTFYQQCVNTNHYSWNNDFSKSSSTKVSATLDIPYWNLSADVGYAILANNIYYDSLGVVRQNAQAMSVLSASLKKNFVFGPLHLDNQLLFQLSSKPEVVPVPTLAGNLRWYFQFVVQKDETRRYNIMEMQLGVNAWANTKWYSPAWNPNLGVFFNQRLNEYSNGPFFDVFLNIQWKRCCIFIKYQNAGQGWPLRSRDYFSGDGYIVTTPKMDGLKLGITWPFYVQPGRPSGGHGHAD